MLIQDFEWPTSFYNCVVGIWCFCYLSSDEQQKQTTFIKESLKSKGHLVLFETVLNLKEKQVARFYHHNEQ